MKKGLKITLGIVGSIICALVIFLCVWFLWPFTQDFYKNATKEWSIPGLDSGFVPQAFTKIDGQDKYIVGGYMAKGEPSRYYIVDKTTGEVDKYFTLSIDAKDYVGHACGIASQGDNLWICSNDDGGKAYRFSLATVTGTENGEKVAVIDHFATNNGADNITIYNNMLWVGEFYTPKKYETNESHHLKTRSGETNMAVAYGYEINADGTIVDAVADKALSLPAQVQGMAFTSTGEIILSTSYSLPDSKIYAYDDVLNETAHSTIEVDGTNVDLWYLDDQAKTKTINAPAMSEEIVIDGDKLLILNESACKKYSLFVRDKISNIYSLTLAYVLENNK